MCENELVRMKPQACSVNYIYLVYTFLGSCRIYGTWSYTRGNCFTRLPLSFSPASACLIPSSAAILLATPTLVGYTCIIL